MRNEASCDSIDNRRERKERLKKMETRMKRIRILAGASLLFIFVFMVLALLGPQQEEIPLLPEKLEYHFNNDWLMIPLEETDGPGAQPQPFDEIIKQARAALEAGEYQKVDLPYTRECSTGTVVVFRNTLEESYAGLTMNFSSKDAIVRVMVDGSMIYQYGGGKDETGSHENFVVLPKTLQDEEVWIELTALRPDAAALGSVKLETRDMIVIGMVGGSIADIACCLLLVIMAIIMFVLALIRRYTGRPSRGEAFLGLAELVAGIYCFIGTDTLSIFYDLHEAYGMQEYLMLMVPLFMTLYYLRNYHAVFPRRFTVLMWVIAINAGVQIVLQVLNVRNMEDMVKVTAGTVFAVCVVAIVSLLQYDAGRRRCQVMLSALSLAVLLAGAILNILLNAFYYHARFNTAGQYSMVIYSVAMAVVHTLQISKEYRAAAEESARLLQEKVEAAEQQNMQLVQAKQDADAARAEALAANEAKGKFLARMSHEIRTPINAVLGMDEMILRESGEQAIKDYAMDIYTAGQTLLSLINDILDFSRIDSGKMEIVPVAYDISSLIHDLANMTAQRAKDKNLRFEVEVDPAIPARLYGDDVRIRQILTNILTNAVKYTHEGTVWLRVSGRRADEAVLLCFEVEDTGIGIREEDLPKLSAEFERIEEDRNRNIEGTGLGMNITIQLLAMLGSRLQVESAYGKGSKFYFELKQPVIDETPIGDFESRVRQMAEDYHYSTKLCAPDARILVVDDNAVNRKVFRNLLKETQVQIADAESGRQCLKLVQESCYDLIFLDHMMPEMDGVETLHHMKALADYPCQDTPVVMLTANAVSGMKETYLAEGFDDFLSKPIVPDKLEHVIRKWLPKELLREAAASEPKGEPQEAGEDALEALPAVDGLDWQYAWLHLPDLNLLEYTVKEFYAQIGSAADKLEQAYRQIEEEGFSPYRIQVHAMKSLSATVGILPLSGVAKLLECAARDERIDVVSSVTGAFLEEWRSYSEKLQGVFGIGTGARKEAADASVISALVEMIRLSMQEMDIDQADRLMGQLQEYEYPDETRAAVSRLAEAVTNLDIEEADRLADVLIGQMERKDERKGQ